jgi:hypothetical protein
MLRLRPHSDPRRGGSIVATSPDYPRFVRLTNRAYPPLRLILWTRSRSGLGAATDLFCAAKAAEGASPRTVECYHMILVRAVRRFGEARPVDAHPGGRVAGLAPRAPLHARARIDRRLCPGSQGLRQLVRRRGGRRRDRLPKTTPTEGAAPAHCPLLRPGAAEPPHPDPQSVSPVPAAWHMPAGRSGSR